MEHRELLVLETGWMNRHLFDLSIGMLSSGCLTFLLRIFKLPLITVPGRQRAADHLPVGHL
jgi:hypothetical protein